MLDEGLSKLDELERLLNDPDVVLQPFRIWALADEIAGAESLGDRLAAH